MNNHCVPAQELQGIALDLVNQVREQKMGQNKMSSGFHRSPSMPSFFLSFEKNSYFHICYVDNHAIKFR